MELAIMNEKQSIKGFFKWGNGTHRELNFRHIESSQSTRCSSGDIKQAVGHAEW